jgi:hypothetical protein
MSNGLFLTSNVKISSANVESDMEKCVEHVGHGFSGNLARLKQTYWAHTARPGSGDTETTNATEEG